VTQEEVVAGVVDVLERLGVVYMVAGPFASNFHGVPRMTQDADLVIEIDEPGVVRLVRALEHTFYVSEDAAREAVRLRRLFNAIHLETGFKVDLVVKKDRPFSDEELKRRGQGRLAGRLVSIASAEDTILSKLEWSRDGRSDRQFADARAIVQFRVRLSTGRTSRGGRTTSACAISSTARAEASRSPERASQRILSAACSARAAPIAVFTFFTSSSGGRTAFIPSDSIHSSRHQPRV
jgi:hypothetical protein